MSLTLWIIQVCLAAVFATAGLTKLVQPKEKLVTGLPWVGQFPAPAVKLIGLADLLGGIGVIAPTATGILPWLAPLAAAGLATMMVLAVLTHARRREPRSVGFNLILLSLAVTVAIGRSGTYAL
jgi:uncharacterized membrane protein YphA (DoxX/SURF4 family)